MNSETHQNSFISDKFVRFAIMVAILLIGFSVFYYLVIFLPKKNSQQLEQKIQLETLDIYKQSSTEQKIQKCLDDVDSRIASPEFKESIKGIKANSKDAEIVLDLIKQAKDECYKKYSQ